MLYFFDKKNIDALKRAASCDSLAEVWRNGFKNMIDKHAMKEAW